MNEGQVRVLFGSTSMLGTGVNAQKRCVAIHHCDTPWRPSDLEQRNGRGVRKGNEVAKLYADNKVDVIIYAVEQSLDSYKFNLLHNKQLFITQLKKGATGSRTIDEGSMDESSGMNFSEYMTILSGNTSLLEKAKVQKQIMALEGERKTFTRDKEATKRELGVAISHLAQAEETLRLLTADHAKLEAAKLYDEQDQVINCIQLDGIVCDDLKGMAEKLREIDEKFNTHGNYQRIGSLYGFPLVVKTKTDEQLKFSSNLFFVDGNYKYSFNYGHLAQDPQRSMLYFLNALAKIPNLMDDTRKEIATLQENIPKLEKISSTRWKKEELLKEKRSELSILERTIQQDIDKKNYSEEELSVCEEVKSEMLIPQEIKGVRLTEEQQQNLRDGKEIFLENMLSSKGKPFSAMARVDFEKGTIFFEQAEIQHVSEGIEQSEQEAPYSGKTLKI